MLIVYSPTLLNMLITSKSFLLDSLEFSTETTRSPMNKDSFSNYLFYLFIFILLYWLGPLVHAERSESEHSRFISKIRGKAFVVTIKCDFSCKFFTGIVHQVEEVSFNS